MYPKSLFVYFVVFGAIAAIGTIAPPALAYDDYRVGAAPTNCSQCHTSFVGRGALHDLHVGNQQMTGTCNLCHTQTGDIPKTWTSGATDGQGCRGCHGVDNGTEFGWGAGLRLHHLNAGAPPDANGDLCSDCHTNDPAPSPESTVPVYYLRGDVNVKDPCNSTTADGEDVSGDNQGLDNDGDLVYDEADSDCNGQVGIVETLRTPPRRLVLLSIHPNPTKSSRATEILFGTRVTTPATIEVFDIAGRSVLRNEISASAGWQRTTIDGLGSSRQDLPAGLYVVRISTDRESASHKLVVFR